MLTEVAAERLPPRRPRHNPRAVKRKMSNYNLRPRGWCRTLRIDYSASMQIIK